MAIPVGAVGDTLVWVQVLKIKSLDFFSFLYSICGPVKTDPNIDEYEACLQIDQVVFVAKNSLLLDFGSLKGKW